MPQADARLLPNNRPTKVLADLLERENDGQALIVALPLQGGHRRRGRGHIRAWKRSASTRRRPAS